MSCAVGVEEEYLLVERNTADLASRRAEALPAAQRHLGDAVTAELNDCQIEVNAPPVHTLAEVVSALDTLRHDLAEALDPLGLMACPLASHPWSSWSDQRVNTTKKRYAELAESYQRVAREQVICGCHVHVAVDDPEARIRVLNRVRPWLPALLALSTNSPFWEGEDTGYASFRTMMWRRWPTATMPPTLSDAAAYNKIVGDLEQVEAISSPQSLYWYVRPSSHLPTVEFRVTDVCLSVDDAATIAGLCRALVGLALEHPASQAWAEIPGPVLEASIWRAARYGLAGTLLHPDSASLRPAPDVVSDLARLGARHSDPEDAAFIREGVARILQRGTGADAQRRFARQCGSRPELLDQILAAHSG